jgi:hypothetical protein
VVSARGLVLTLLVACGEDRARVRVVPISPCGQVTNETALRVVGYTAEREQRRTVPPDDIDSFPADTEQLGVELIGDSGKLVAVGKTAPLELNALANATEIPIVMAPLDGMCPVGPMTEPRHSPLVARAGDGVLVVGGTGAAGEPLATAELYDRATASFVAVDVPPTLMDGENGLAGAVLTELADGRVALTGTSSHAIAIFDPSTRTFSAPNLFDHRAFHGALAVDGAGLLVIGGCADVVAGACSGATLSSGFIYDLADVTMRDRGPTLEPGAARHGASMLRLGIQSDGSERFLLAGGFGDPGIASRFALTDMNAERIEGLGAQVAVLDGGAVLSAFATEGTLPPAVVLPPDRTQVVPLGATPAIAGASLTTLEDGSVVAFGDRIDRYNPTGNRWTAITAGQLPGALDRPSTLLLGDGTVLVVGGASTADAWIFRPSLVGPRSGAVIVVPDGNDDDVLTASDPSTVDRSAGGFVLETTDDDLHARALVGGPRMARGSVSAIVRAQAGGVALIAQQTGPGRALVGRLVPGEPARILSLDGGTLQILCTGTLVTDVDLMAPLSFAINGDIARLSVGVVGAATVKATCAVPVSERGAWGIAAAGTGARIELGPVTVERAL